MLQLSLPRKCHRLAASTASLVLASTGALAAPVEVYVVSGVGVGVDVAAVEFGVGNGTGLGPSVV